jgi:hypothetical protein
MLVVEKNDPECVPSVWRTLGIVPANERAQQPVNVDNDTLRRVLDNPEAMAAVERIEGWCAR